MRYLGVRLSAYDPNCVTARLVTENHFIKKLRFKWILFRRSRFNYHSLPIKNKIEVLKAFLHMYYEIFAQVLRFDEKALDSINKQADGFVRKTL